LSASVYSIVNVKPEWKASEYVWQIANSQKGSIEVLVSFYQNVDAQVISRYISGIGGELEQSPMAKYGSYKVILPASRIRTAAEWYGVRSISPVTEIAPLDIESRPVVKGNIAAGPAAYGGYGLTGAGVTVGVGDDASGIYHADINDRIINFNPGPRASHGSHVNGIVGGAGNVDPFAIGMATHVSLVDFLYEQVLYATPAMYTDFGMTVTNNSYTISERNCTYNGTYDAYSQFLDTLALQYPDVLHVFASGNDGLLNCAPYPAGFATVGGGYQPAKNIVVVGSVLDGLKQAPDESRGPVKDGRLKPEITALGVVAYSTVPFDQYIWAAGTSMASPQVAGGIAELTERYKQLNSGSQPRADLLKTVLLNGAMDMGNPGPDYSFGFGIMDLYRSLQMLDNNRYAVNSISNGDSQFTTISVPPNTEQLKVMLYWSDRPASPSSAKQLVNDLDLKVLDPSGAQHLPLVLDPTPANVNNNATEQPDHLNNVEQVTVSNPPAGTYTIRTKGYNIPYGPQRYIIAWDFIPKGLHLTFPVGGEQLANKTTAFDTIRVFWDAVSDGNTFTVQFSQDNGSNWTTISGSVPADAKYCGFIAGSVNSGRCLVRVLRNGTAEVVTSGPFTICTQPVVALDTAQCPGYINIHWSPVPNATAYYLLRKIGAYMQVVDSVTDTLYSFKNMPLTVNSYVAVQPVVDGKPGFRSLALITKANTGNCTNPVSSGDLMVEKLVSRNAGRLHSSTEFVAGAPVQVRVRNLYTAACNNYNLFYKVNTGVWQTLISPVTIPANNYADVNLTGISLSTPGQYQITVAVQNTALPDPQQANDTLSFVITCLQNNPVSLAAPFTDGFESMSAFSVSHDSMGVSPNQHWDFSSSDEFGRMRSFVNDNITITGARSVSLDENQSVTSGSNNKFTGTFNLSGYDTANTEARLDFDYVLHGIPLSGAGNFVSVRGYDTSSWTPFYAYDLNTYPGTLTHVKSLSLTDALTADHHNFSTATQICFGQNDTSLIALESYGNGMTLDNVRIYTVANDAALVSVTSPLAASCGISAPQPVTVQVHNGVHQVLHNIQLFYSLDGGTAVTGTIDSIPSKGTVSYTFAQPVNVSLGVSHSLNVWLSVAGDTYKGNDTILNYHFRNSPVITAYPYLENFEQGDGGYYSDGYRNSWQYGTPAAPKINKAASGTKAWKTNLAGNYSDLELSYLYSPCFDISQLTNPMLSFSAAMDVENCGRQLCDAAYVEISYDGIIWTKLGVTGQGTNWYDSTFNVWNTEGFTRWHVVSTPLPAGAGQTIHLRFVLAADPGLTFEGLAIDDIHIFDRTAPIYPADANVSATQSISGNNWTDVTLSNKLLASLQPSNQSINNTGVSLYKHDTLTNPGETQYTMPRSYTIKAAQGPADSIGIRLYLTENELLRVLDDTTCPSCSRFPDAYSLGITQYGNIHNTGTENGTLLDDTGGVFVYYPHNLVSWVPQDDGYYAEIKTKSLSEFWFNDGGPTGNVNAATDYLTFLAYRTGEAVTASWYSLIDTAVNIYTPQWALDTTKFVDIMDTPARHTSPAEYQVVDPVSFSKYPGLVIYYRLKWTMTGKDGVFFSPIRRVTAADTEATLITFDAQMVDHKNVLLSWNSKIDGVVNHYLLERARGQGAYQTIRNVPSLHHFVQDYGVLDQPGADIPSGTLMHYRLTAIMEDGKVTTLPERTVEWINVNSVDKVYPNPTHNGDLAIEWHADPGSVMRISISDMVGKVMYETSVTSAQWDNVTKLQTFPAPRGVYMLRVDIDGRRYNWKVVYE
jgi:hypothetical protein